MKFSCKSEESEGEVDNPVIEEYDPLAQGGASITGSREYLQAGTPSYKVYPRYSKQLCETSFTPFDNEIHDILSSHSSQRVTFDEDDYDKMFLLSLLPIIRQVPEEKKLDVRIQMQQVLAMALRSSDNKWVIWCVFFWGAGDLEERKREVNTCQAGKDFTIILLHHLYSSRLNISYLEYIIFLRWK